MGVALSMGISSWRPVIERLSASVAALFGFTCLLGLGLSLIWVDPTAFPWLGAIVPAFSAAGLLMLTVTRTEDTLVGLLATAPMVFVGKLSYSLYLWHWPVIVFMRWTVGIDTLWLQVLAGALSAELARLKEQGQ